MMNAISIPILPTGLWLLASASGIAIVMVCFFLYVHMRRRYIIAQDDLREISDLTAAKEQLGADVASIRQWISSQQDELSRLQVEREEQERIRGDLARLQTECASHEQRMIEMRGEIGELESSRHTLTQTIERLKAEAETLQARINELEAQRSRLSDLQTQIAEAERKLKEALVEREAALQEAGEAARQLAEKHMALDALRQQCNSMELQRQNLEQIVIKKTGEAGDAENRAQIKTQELAELEKQLQNKQNTLQQIETQCQQVESTVRQLEGHRADIQKQCEALGQHLNSMELQRQNLKQLIDRVTTELADTEKRLQSKTQKLAELEEQLQDRRNALQQIEAQCHQVESTIKRLEDERAALQKQCDTLVQQRDLMELKRQDLDQIIKRRTTEAADAEKLLQTKTQKLTEVAKQLREKQDVLQQIEVRCHQLESRIKRLEADRSGLEIECKKLEKKLPGPDGSPGTSDDPYADLLKTAPVCLDKTVFSEKRVSWPSEEDAVDNVIQGLNKIGYRFDDRVVKAFHTSLKCHDINPLTVLAGVSGTGKTLLPMAYSRLMGMHSLVMAVQPRWDSPQDMFGFYNYLERRYKATDLARSLLRMDIYNSPAGLDNSSKVPDRVLLVLLDEMNLARTEYYFSEFLSKLELRRDIANPEVRENRIHAEIVLDTGPGRDDIRVWVDKNVLFVGTMNEDESTQTLSDKVLDRANVLRFGRPKDVSMPKERVKDLPAHGYLTQKEWKGWLRAIESRGWTDQVTRWITRLNDSLNRIGRPFGYRVQKSIFSYVMNYPGIEGNSTYKQAFADQIEQKVLPKLRGIEVFEGGANATLEEIEEIISQTGDELLLKAFSDAKQEAAAGMFIWRGVTR